MNLWLLITVFLGSTGVTIALVLLRARADRTVQRRLGRLGVGGGGRR